MTSMSDTAMSRPQPNVDVTKRSPRWFWLGWAVVAALFVLLFGNFMERMFWIATSAAGSTRWARLVDAINTPWNPDWSHALVIPFIGLYYLHLHRGDLAATPADSRWTPLEHAYRWLGLFLLGAILSAQWFWPSVEPRIASYIHFGLKGPLLILVGVAVLFGPDAHRWVWAPMLRRWGQDVSLFTWMRLLGLFTLVLATLNYFFWIFPGRNDMMQGYSVVLALFGLMLMLLGPGPMRWLWFPVFFLVFSVKVAQKLWDQIAWQLQIIASHTATLVLKLLGIDATVTGSTIELFHGVQFIGKLNVAEACSGLRMLAAFVALGVAMAFLFDRAWWQRLIMVLLTVPIAVAVNVGRVTTLGALYLVDPELASGDFHTFIGLLMLIPAAAAFLLLGWILDRIIIREEADPNAPPVRLDRGLPATTTQLGDANASDSAILGYGKRMLPAVGLGLLIAGSALGMYAAWFRPDVTSFLPGDVRGLTAAAAALLAAAAAVFAVTRLQRFPRGNGVALGLAAGVMLTAALGLQGLLVASGAVLIKGEVPLRQKLFMMPTELKGWKMVYEDPPLSAEILETLGTRDYVSRVYQDQSAPNGAAGARVRLHVAYYTGAVDTVPHVPDRCFVAGGVRPVRTAGAVLHLQGAGLVEEADGSVRALSRLEGGTVLIPTAAVPATVFTYTPAERPDQASNVVYFFAANGRFFATPEDVRLSGAALSDRFSYYCKIEVGVPEEANPEAAVASVKAFLATMLPEVMACLPDWAAVQAGDWPPSSAAAAPTLVQDQPQPKKPE